MSETRELHQSGEKVLSAGIYRLVTRTLEPEAGTLVTLYQGDFFPNEQGRPTSWYLVCASTDGNAISVLSPAWHDIASIQSVS